MHTMIKWWKERGAFVPFAGLCLILPGVQAAICTTLDNKMPYWEMMGIYSVISLLLVFLIFLLEHWPWETSIFLLVTTGLLVWKNRWDIAILDQAEVLAYYIDQKYQDYMNQRLFPQEWCNWGELRGNIALIGFCVLVGMYIAWTTLKLYSKLLMSMPIILLYCGALLLGVTPGQLPTLLLIIGMALEMLWISERQKIRSSFKLQERTEQVGSGKRICIVVLILMVGLSISWHLSSRISGQVFRNVNSIQIRQLKMEQKLRTVVETKGQQLRGRLGIDSGGYLSNVAPKYQNKPVFTVTLSDKPTNSLYLRGFVGDVYQGGKWKASENIKKESGNRKKGIWQGKYCESQYTLFDSEELDITIQYTRLGKRSKYLYTPYSRSGAINEKNTEEGKLCLGKEDEELPLYQELAEEMRDDSFGVTSDLIVNIQNVLWSNASYSLQLDPIPRNQDYAEYFLFYSQMGYCEHFATAGTLLLRNLNHTARYVSGYRVSSNRFIYNKEDGTYIAEVLDSDAHAWSEVWVKEGHWMPQEMTPSGEDSESVQVATYGGHSAVNNGLSTPTAPPPAQQTPELAETEKPEKTEKPERTETPSSEPKSGTLQDDHQIEKGDSGSGSGSQEHWSLGKWWKSLPRWQHIFLIVSGVVVGVLILIDLYGRNRKRRKRRRMAQMREHNRSAYIRLRLGVFLERLHHSGVAVRTTMPEQQWLQVLSEELLEKTNPREMETVAELVRRAAYSREMVTEMEVDWFDGYCDRIEGSLTRKFPGFRDKIVKAVQK